METKAMSRWLNNRHVVYWGVAILSGLVTLYAIASRDVINNDGILYINVAKAFLAEGIRGAIQVYNWPAYGILIGLVHEITGLGYENSANGLNTLFLIVASVMFVRIYEDISGKDSRIWVAAILILALPVLNDYRDFVIRGYGFWAFMLMALHYFIQYCRSPGFQHAWKWQLCMVVAILFRFEGLAFLVLAPLCLLFMADRRGRILAHLFTLNSVLLMGAVAGALILFATGTLQLSAIREIPYQLDYASPLALMSAINAEAAMMFSRNRFMASVDEARLILAAGLLMLVFVKVVSNIGAVFLVVWVYGARQRWLQLGRESYIVLFFAAIAFSSLIPVAGNFFFLSSRYTVPTVLLISLITFQYVDYLFRELNRRQWRKWSIAAWLVVMALFLDGVVSGGASKRIIRDAGEWVFAEMPAEARIACNEARLEFYADGKCKWVMFGEAGPAAAIHDLGNEGFSYLLLWIGRKDDVLRMAAESDSGLELEKEFLNSRGDAVRLYKMKAGGL